MHNVNKLQSTIGHQSHSILFSLSLHLLPEGEPDSPVLKDDEKKLQPRSAIIPLKCKDDVGTPVLKYIVRYRQVRHGVDLFLAICVF